MALHRSENELAVKWQFEELPEGLSNDVATALLSAALRARTNAYAPYSSFAVGAAVLTDDGRIFSGSNVENASYGATICAERAAIFSAVGAGYRSISAVAVVAEYSTPIPPCGMCRQVIAEFSSDAVVLMANTDGVVTIRSMHYLLPSAFNLPKRRE